MGREKYHEETDAGLRNLIKGSTVGSTGFSPCLACGIYPADSPKLRYKPSRSGPMIGVLLETEIRQKSPYKFKKNLESSGPPDSGFDGERPPESAPTSLERGGPTPLGETVPPATTCIDYEDLKSLTHLITNRRSKDLTLR